MSARAADRRMPRDIGIGLFFGVIFLLALLGQAVAGHAAFNNEQVSQGLQTLTFLQYLTSASFTNDVMENWQSEYLQFLLYVLATVWLVHRGSPESKEPGDEGRMSDKDQLVGEHAKRNSPAWAKVGGWRRWLYSRSLTVVMGTIFVLSWLAQSIGGWSTYNASQLRSYEHPVAWLGYVGSADFWSRTLQNWQSEFLAVGSMAVLAVYLRERGSAESKPVGAPHDATGVTP
jgi:membrane protein implicated in regulation of membrane protease activity